MKGKACNVTVSCVLSSMFTGRHVEIPGRNQLHYFNRYLTDDHFTDQSHDTEAIENNIHLMYGPEGNS